MNETTERKPVAIAGAAVTRGAVAPVAPQAVRPDVVSKVGDRYGVKREAVWNVMKATAFRGNPQVSDADIMAFMIVCDQHGLNPFTREIYAFKDFKTNAIVPMVGVDGWIRIVNEHPQFNGMEFTYSTDMVESEEHRTVPAWVECTMYRRDRDRPTIAREYFDECYQPPRGASKSPGPWQSHPKRFLRHRSFIQCARLAFGFALADEDDAITYERGADGTYQAPEPQGDRPVIDTTGVKVGAAVVAEPEPEQDNSGDGGQQPTDTFMLYNVDGEAVGPVNAVAGIIQIEKMIEGQAPQVVAAVLTANADMITGLAELEYAAAGIFADKLAQAEAALAAPKKAKAPPKAKEPEQAPQGPVLVAELNLSPDDAAEHERISRRIGKAENPAALAATWKFEQEAIKLLPEAARSNLQRVHDQRFK